MKKLKIKSTHCDCSDRGWFVTAETDDGEIWAHENSFGHGYIAEKKAMCQSIDVAISGEIDTDHWGYVRSIYGSQAWIKNKCEQAEIEKEINESR